MDGNSIHKPFFILVDKQIAIAQTNFFSIHMDGNSIHTPFLSLQINRLKNTNKFCLYTDGR